MSSNAPPAGFSMPPEWVPPRAHVDGVPAGVHHVRRRPGRRARLLPRRVGGSHQRDRALRAGVVDLQRRRRRGRPGAGRSVGRRFTRRRSTSAGSATAARRSSPIPTAGLGAVCWTFNGWGQQEFCDWDDEQHVGAFAAGLAGAEVFPSSMVNEGGGIHVDGEGTVMITRDRAARSVPQSRLGRSAGGGRAEGVPRCREGGLAAARA